jgi:hypothetical protein
VLKKYPNRRLYDTSASTYITLADVKTMVMTMLKLPYRDSSKQAWKASWQSGLPHTHHALSDAREQGVSFCKMLQELHTT